MITPALQVLKKQIMIVLEVNFISRNKLIVATKILSKFFILINSKRVNWQPAINRSFQFSKEKLGVHTITL